MKVYVVLEEDRGCGVTVNGVYLKEQDAINYIDGNSHYWYKEEEVQGLDEEVK